MRGGPKLKGLTTTHEIRKWKEILAKERSAEQKKELARNPREVIPNHELPVRSHFPVYEAYMTMTMSSKGLSRRAQTAPSTGINRCGSSPTLSSSGFRWLEDSPTSEKAGSACGSSCRSNTPSHVSRSTPSL
jgi:hypothetical protein